MLGTSDHNVVVQGLLTTNNGINNTGEITTDRLTTTGRATLNNAVIEYGLSVGGQTNTNGIENVGLIFTDTLETTGDASVGGNLTVTGATNTNGITNTGDITNSGNISTGTLAVTGASTTTGITNTGDITNSGKISTGTLAVTGATTLSSTLAVTGATTLASTLAVAGATTTNGITNTGNISTGTLSTSGTASVGGTLNMNSNKITNVANGTATNDAVNFGQLSETRKMLSGGIAATIAMANIPLVDTDKSFAVGVALGGYDDQSAIAAGASYRLNPSTVFRGSIAGGSASKTAVGAGLSFSW